MSGEFGIVGGEVTVSLLDCVQFTFGILDAIRVAEGVFKNLNQGSQIREVHSVVLHVGGDLIKGVILKAVDSESEFFWDGGEGGGLQTELYKEGAEVLAVSTILLGVWDLLGSRG